VLLVEGNDELRALPELLELTGVPWPRGNEPVHIKQLEGVENILATGLIEAEAKASGLLSLGILLDADGDIETRWRRVQERMTESFSAFPHELEPDGTIFVPDGGPRVGVWIMPDNVRSGMLETMLLGLRSGAPAVSDYARQAVARARAIGATFRDAHRDKAELHTWLAWQDPPGLQVHLAVKSRIISPEPGTCGGFVGWFRALFEV
jgi:hypothetical protein